MSDRLRLAIVPAYLLLCLLLGGSGQGIWANVFLQLTGIAVIAWAFVNRRSERQQLGVRRLGVLVALALGLVALQLIPLPPAIWTALPGRAMISDGFALLGLPPAWQPLSLAPYDGVATALTLLPPLAILAAMIWTKPCPSRWIAVTVIAATFAGVALGALQVASSDPAASGWYFYKYSNFGMATGFFANSNHMATLLLIAIPFVVALASAVAQGTEDVRKRHAAIAIGTGGLAVVLVGLTINGSLAGLGLAPIVTIASGLLILRPRHGWVRAGAMAAGALSLGLFVAVVATPLGERFESAGVAQSISTRQEIREHSVEAIRTFGPAGSGLGTFRPVYSLFEDPNAVDLTYINHAHNDYLELALEMGVAGIALILLFFAWWVTAARQLLRSPAYDQYAVAGLIASAAVLIHSAADFPLRTASISGLFAISLALMLVSRHNASSSNDLRATRHVVID